MSPSDISPETPYEDLVLLYDTHCAPFESEEQASIFIRVASILQRRVPEETEHSGERLRLRDLEVQLQRATRWRAARRVACRTPPHRFADLSNFLN